MQNNESEPGIAITDKPLRLCSRCDRLLPHTTDFFYHNKRWFEAICKKCRRIAARKDKLRNRFGLTPKEYNAMLASQNGVCAICSLPPEKFRLAVDHDHKTGQVRGLLCRPCNTAIGLLHDDPVMANKAVDYLVNAKH